MQPLFIILRIEGTSFMRDSRFALSSRSVMDAFFNECLEQRMPRATNAVDIRTFFCLPVLIFKWLTIAVKQK